MKERDLLRLSGPHGSFFLQDSAKPMLLVAGGTGLAPIKAIVEHAIGERSTRPMTVYWGGRTRADLYLLPLAEQWAQAGVRFVPVLSEPAAGDHWSGRSGLVHAAAMADFTTCRVIRPMFAVRRRWSPPRARFCRTMPVA